MTGRSHSQLTDRTQWARGTGLSMQSRYDLETEKDRLTAKLNGIRPLSAAS